MKRFIVSGLIVLVAMAPPAFAAKLTPLKDLAADARIARRQAMPIVVLFSSEACYYCGQVMELHLEPMAERGPYAQRVLFRVAEIEKNLMAKDFNGRTRTYEELAGIYRVSLTPHIKILDPDGRELVPPIIGYNTAEFYRGYLEEAIDTAIAKLRAGAAGTP